MRILFLLVFLPAFSLAQQRPLAELEAGWKKYGLYQKTGWELPIEIGSYKAGKWKVAGWAGIAIGGFANGLLQGYEFDGRRSFERKWGVSKRGFWGSESWRMRYKNGNPEDGLAHPAYKVLPVPDFWHTAQFVQNHSTVVGGICVGIGAVKENKEWWHYAVDFAVSFGINSCSRAAGVYLVRT